MATPKKGILIAFGELFLKSEGVKAVFRKRLVQNLSFSFEKKGLDCKIHISRERIFIETSEVIKALKIINNTFGIAWLADCLFFPKANLKEVLSFIKKNHEEWIKKDETFAIKLRRGEDIPKKDRDKVIADIAKVIKRKVNLSRPKKEIFIEARKEGWFLYFKKIKGKGGLPVGSGGKVLSLISGGIDSPIAAFLIAKRGGGNVWLHFHSFPLVSQASIKKVKELAKVFLNYQPQLKVYFVPFHKAQMEIKTKVLAKYRILLYRKLMLKIAEEIAKEEGYQALVTGESLGQVSSQTLPNIKIVEEGIEIPILRPLIGMDKEEIVNLAQEIKTFEISIKPQEDCCTLFTPKHASAEGKIEEIRKSERKLNIQKIIEGTIKEIKIEKY